MKASVDVIAIHISRSKIEWEIINPVHLIIEDQQYVSCEEMIS